MKYYKGTFGTEDLHLAFRHRETAGFFGSWLEPEQASGELSPSQKSITVPESDMNEFLEKWKIPVGPYNEYLLSLYRCCDALLKHGECVFHGAVFSWRGRAFLFTAASGVGKTTQLRHWQTLCGDELTILNGDKPILQADRRPEGGSILIHPSPWKGKENLGEDCFRPMPLSGIIYLEQAGQNAIRRMTPQEAVEPILKRILSTFETEETALAACAFEDQLLKKVPVWKLKNVGDLDAAILTQKILISEVYEHEI